MSTPTLCVTRPVCETHPHNADECAFYTILGAARTSSPLSQQVAGTSRVLVEPDPLARVGVGPRYLSADPGQPA
jgi:hypothetical protein